MLGRAHARLFVCVPAAKLVGCERADGTRLPGYRVDRSGYPGISIYTNVTGDTHVDIEVVRR